jgi:cell division protein FtsZ
MEVDEAASHIKELVDPDANIIWGSAFNNDLDGKIRVSVVATGIEAENGVQAQPAKVFTFPARPAAAPVAPAAEATGEATDDADDGDALDLTEEVSDDESGEGEELLLDSDDILTSPVGSAPIAPPSDDDIASTETDEAMPAEQPKAAAAGGGTLFERMSSIARGAPRAQIDEDKPAPGFSNEPIDIPRFLNRQNNQ